MKKFLCVNVDAVEPVYPQASKLTSLKSLSLDSLLNQLISDPIFGAGQKIYADPLSPNVFMSVTFFVIGFTEGLS